MSRVRLRSRLRPLLLLVLLAAGTVTHRRLGLSTANIVSATRALTTAHETLAPPIFIVLCIGGMLLHAPEILFIAAGGVLFGALGGFVYGWIAATVGTTCTFLLARYFLHDATQRLLRRRWRRLRALDERLARRGFATVLALRLVLFLAPPVNWAIGATRVRYVEYLAGSALGVVPGIAITVLFADRASGLRSWSELLAPEFALPALVLLMLVTASAVALRSFLGAADEHSVSPERPD